jgi:hypothetical protein
LLDHDDRFAGVRDCRLGGQAFREGSRRRRRWSATKVPDVPSEVIVSRALKRRLFQFGTSRLQKVQRACNTSFEFVLSKRRHLDKKPISQHAENASPKMIGFGSAGFLGLGLEDEAGDGVARGSSPAGGD